MQLQFEYPVLSLLWTDNNITEGAHQRYLHHTGSSASSPPQPWLFLQTWHRPCHMMLLCEGCWGQQWEESVLFWTTHCRVHLSLCQGGTLQHWFMVHTYMYIIYIIIYIIIYYIYNIYDIYIYIYVLLHIILYYIYTYIILYIIYNIHYIIYYIYNIYIYILFLYNKI